MRRSFSRSLASSFFALFASLLLLPSCGDSPTAPRGAQIVGRVLDSSGDPAANVRVLVTYPVPPAPAVARRAPSSPNDIGVGGPVLRGFSAWNNPVWSGALGMEMGIQTTAHVQIRILDRKAKVARTICDRSFAAGRHALVWDGTSDTGEYLPNDLYTARWVDTENDSVFTADVPVLLSLGDAERACNVVTNARGQFSIPLLALPLDMQVEARDAEGNPRGIYRFPESIDLVASKTVGAYTHAAVTNVPLGDRQRNVSVTIQLP